MMEKSCRHPKRLWRLTTDRRKNFIVCADCGIRVAAVIPLRTYKEHFKR